MRQMFAERESDKYSLLRLNASNYSGKSVIGRNEKEIINYSMSAKRQIWLRVGGERLTIREERRKLARYSADKTCFPAFQTEPKFLNPKRGVLKKIGVPAF